MKKLQILVFGASITYGAWDKKGGWTTRLREFLDQKTITNPNFKAYIFNLGISGDTTEDLVARFEVETKPRLIYKDTIFIFSIGLNDSQYVHSKKNLRLSPIQFSKNLQKLIDLAKKYSPKIIFVGLNPVDEKKVDPLPWNPEKSYKSKYVKKFDNIIEQVCIKNQIHFIKIYEKFKKENYKNLLDDGAHPNTAGHQKIYKLVKDYLLKKGLI